MPSLKLYTLPREDIKYHIKISSVSDESGQLRSKLAHCIAAATAYGSPCGSGSLLIVVVLAL
jgi:hypothetical protein